MKKPHLFWILIDSARNYETDQDMRGLPKAVVDFGEEGLYFKNVVTSAPSTLQSISSMMTSSPSYLMSRSYNNFRGKFSCFDYFPDMLRDNGYDVIGAIYFKHGREVMSDMFGLLKKKFYPKDLSHSKEIWTNQDVYNLFLEVMAKHDWNKPTMTYLHFNVRVDDNVSDIVNQVVDDMKSGGLYDDSVILMNSDHGYPDADKGYDFEAGLKEGWGHDKYLTDDNILTPLVIRHPKYQSRKIEQAVATIDIVPTLCKMMGIKASEKFHGLDISTENINPRKRLIRTDNRYVGQSPSFHAYTSGRQKAIVYRETGKEDDYSFYNLETDPKEESPSKDKELYKDLYEAILKDEKKLYAFHADFLKSRWNKVFAKEISAKPKSIVIVLPSTPAFQEIVKSVLGELFPSSKIALHKDAGSTKYDIMFLIVESEVPWELGSLKNHSKGINAFKKIFVDNNGVRIKNPVALTMYRRFIGKRWAVISHDPGALFDIFGRVVKQKLLDPIR
tara:strand:- start:11481 stop:12986 length:1506 start_codon:yes stop_codon:yes gene_type:complete